MKPPKLVNRKDGTILLLGQGSDALAVESITVAPLLQVQASTPAITVEPLVIAQTISVPS